MPSKSLMKYRKLVAEATAPCTCPEIVYEHGGEIHYCDPCCDSCEDTSGARARLTAINSAITERALRALERILREAVESARRKEFAILGGEAAQEASAVFDTLGNLMEECRRRK